MNEELMLNPRQRFSEDVKNVVINIDMWKGNESVIEGFLDIMTVNLRGRFRDSILLLTFP